jgi:tetratricopeptide (TPR) repeat protein
VAEEQKQPDIAIPVTAEEFDLGRRKRMRIGVAVALVLAVLGYGVYRRFMDPIHAREAFDDAQRLVSTTRYSQAILACARAISLKPDFADAYYLRGQAYAAQRNLEPAESDYANVIRLEPNGSRGYAGRCGVRLEFKDYDGAIEDCTRAINADSKNARAYNLRGVSMRYKKDMDASLKDLNQAVLLSPDIDNFFQRGATFRALNQYEKAVADFDQAVYLFPGNPEVFRARAETKRAMGDEAGALADYRTGREIESR